MTEKEKAKAYDEAIERAKKLYGNGIAEGIFPELKESDDEKMRNFIINELACLRATDEKSSDRYEELTNAIDWLEKQRDKDKLIQELGEYKVKYTQEVLEKYVNSMSNKDDERLRKTAIAFLKDFAEQGYENAVECIAWLEKQRKPKSYWKPTEEQYEALDYAYNSCPDTERGNYYEGVLETLIEDLHMLEKQGENSTNKIKPRFNVGDWVIFTTSGNLYQVEKKENCEYTLKDIHGGSFCVSFSNEELIREWTIEDARDGDVLSLYTEYKGNKITQICIIEKYAGEYVGCSNMHTFKIYAGVNWANNLQIGKHMGCSDIHPATKEQRDLLFQKIKEAGYEWDADKKELKKLEVKSNWEN